MEAGRVDFVVARDLRRRLAGSKTTVDLGALQMLARFALSHARNIRVRHRL
jgi:hypothetical protein